MAYESAGEKPEYELTRSNMLGSTTVESQKSMDPLQYLPCSTVIDYKKRQVIYGKGQPSTAIYLISDGKVKVSRFADDGQQAVVDIYQRDELFGESAFLGLPHRPEQAEAMENTRLLTWTTEEIEQIIMERPQLAIAILQILAKRSLDFGHRIESFTVDNIARRLTRSLIRLSERLGTPDDDGSVRMAPFTHELLSQYVGTTRGVVTMYMNQFRRQGYLEYSRKAIVILSPAFREWPGKESRSIASMSE